jgi:hypothetical protein
MLDKQPAHFLASIFLFLSASLVKISATQVQLVCSNSKGENVTLDGVAAIRADGLF